jgi:hypothetical protein
MDEDNIPDFQRKVDRRQVPQSDLDFNLIITDPVLGKSSVDLSEFVSEDIVEVVPAGSVVYDHLGKSFITDKPVKTVRKRNLWEQLKFYTRDLRLANLNYQEMVYCQHFLDLAGDYLKYNFISCFLISLRRVATITELSQSKYGFLRRRQSTKTSEQTFQELNPPKAKVWGGSNNKQQYGGV